MQSKKMVARLRRMTADIAVLVLVDAITPNVITGAGSSHPATANTAKATARMAKVRATPTVPRTCEMCSNLV